MPAGASGWIRAVQKPVIFWMKSLVSHMQAQSGARTRGATWTSRRLVLVPVGRTTLASGRRPTPQRIWLLCTRSSLSRVLSLIAWIAARLPCRASSVLSDAALEPRHRLGVGIEWADQARVSLGTSTLEPKTLEPKTQSSQAERAVRNRRVEGGGARPSRSY